MQTAHTESVSQPASFNPSLNIFLYAGRSRYKRYCKLRQELERRIHDYLVGYIDAILDGGELKTDFEVHQEVWRASGVADHQRVRETLLTYSGHRGEHQPRLWQMTPDGSFCRLADACPQYDDARRD